MNTSAISAPGAAGRCCALTRAVAARQRLALGGPPLKGARAARAAAAPLEGSKART